MIIREERKEDRPAVYDLIRRAFASAEHADGNEQDLTEALRKGKSFIPALSLVAEEEGKLIGHILFTEAHIGGRAVLALAPLSVLPEFQRQGVGQALIAEGHRIGKALGYPLSVVLGSETYCPKQGYVPADTLGIEAPFDVPRENFMVCILRETGKDIRGRMEYAEEFGIG